ncbi:uncharacterized protein MONOS_5404 [Monocercomonoides exilis]|uniref:uncharacterized protein n=1 Tax=Monocercomonoides exilis TaxID=2049356 RepID=UPI003559BC07|nr:hypothetical protein MONOS_5404 [Monocercomonoides exilis]|eukprot:MONOS_5404.1-p1 / transcript=MONOS_5404.1 / gene=MONOS_5404 / organism=Monocercomonoides_exilis_PA203 / gene_product=unspecified product / transcript_product=unspecified product / location=Mono_scaffold00156:65704-67197(+) / protein_length=448 / sequence_SO=supercontig / SO=protein_coding / is_pseudo=false
MEHTFLYCLKQLPSLTLKDQESSIERMKVLCKRMTKNEFENNFTVETFALMNEMLMKKQISIQLLAHLLIKIGILFRLYDLYPYPHPFVQSPLFNTLEEIIISELKSEEIKDASEKKFCILLICETYHLLCPPSHSYNIGVLTKTVPLLLEEMNPHKSGEKNYITFELALMSFRQVDFPRHLSYLKQFPLREMMTLLLEDKQLYQSLSTTARCMVWWIICNSRLFGMEDTENVMVHYDLFNVLASEIYSLKPKSYAMAEADECISCPLYDARHDEWTREEWVELMWILAERCSFFAPSLCHSSPLLSVLQDVVHETGSNTVSTRRWATCIFRRCIENCCAADLALLENSTYVDAIINKVTMSDNDDTVTSWAMLGVRSFLERCQKQRRREEDIDTWKEMEKKFASMLEETGITDTLLPAAYLSGDDYGRKDLRTHSSAILRFLRCRN